MIKLVIKISITCIISTASVSSFAQGYKIDLTVDGMEIPDLYLGYYINGKTYVEDSAEYIGNGIYSFQGDESLKPGMYFFAKKTTLLFDLVIGEDQFFELKAKEGDYISSVEIFGDEDNRLFFDNLKFNLERRKEGTPYLEILSDSIASIQEKQEAQKKVEAINRKVFAYQDNVIAEFPESILGMLFLSGKEVEIPSKLNADTSEQGRRKRFYYYRNHFWDNFDLGNPFMLRLPNTLYNKKIDDYLDNLISQNPDSLKVAIDQLARVAKKDSDTYQYFIWNLTLKYQSSKLMGMDEVYVHIVDSYFMTGEMDFWANDQLKRNLREKADQYRNSLIGMVAPNLVLQDLEEQPKELHDLTNKYTIIYFYDPDCGHCKKETPILKEFYDSNAFDIGVYTVSADTSMTKMKNYIEEVGIQSWTNTNGTRAYGIKYLDKYDAFTTPTIYLLNEKKEIIAKKIKASQLNDAISGYERVQLELNK